MAYISSSDITDNVIKTIVSGDTTYLDRADDAFEDLALSLGVATEDIYTTPLPFLCKEFLKAYVGYEVCFDNAGNGEKMTISENIVADVYMEKLKYYEKRLSSFKAQLTYEIILGEADTPQEYSAYTARIYRG